MSTQKRQRRAARWPALALSAGLTLAACGTSSAGEPTASSGGEQGDGQTMVISGSSTVEPISALNAEKFNEGNVLAISVSGPGTGDGFKMFCNAEIDIADASRPIKDEERAECEKNGVDYVELKIANDGLSVITSKQNDAVKCLAFGDLYALLGPESNGFTQWSDADKLSQEVGGKFAPYQDKQLAITAPGEESGTYDSFIELALKDIAEERGQQAAVRKDYTSSPNDNVIVQAIAGSPSTLGWVGYAFVVENLDKVKAIEVDGGKGCVAPTDATVADASYPLSRPLFIYVNKQKAVASKGVRDFVDFYLSDAGIASVSEAGYVKLSDSDYQKARQTWEAVTAKA